MPINPTYPGVYIDELPSSVHTITGVPTSVAAFVGAASRGPTSAPVHTGNFGDFQRTFGGVSSDSPLSYAVYQFYLNGGSDAEVVRLASADAVSATLDLGDGVKLAAIGPGTWGDSLRARVNYQTAGGPPAGGAAATSYNLSVLDTSTGVLESYLNISTTPSDAQSLDKVLSASSLVAIPAGGTVLDVAPAANAAIDPGDPDQNPFSDAHTDRYTEASGGEPGSALALADYTGGGTGQADKLGIYQLYKTDIFNLLCLPGAPPDILTAAATLCVERRAILLVDPPGWSSVANAVSVMGGTNPPVSLDVAGNAAVYFPNVQIADPSQNGITVTKPPCGTVAGIAARTDVARGVWKAPAGTDASLNGVTGLATGLDGSGTPLTLTDNDNGLLNPLGVNCLRSFPVVGPVVWGARTLRGADRLADQWKYLPIRRLALFIEESLFRGTQWVVFEPNDEPLWASIRMNVGTFMNTLFRQGAFQGSTANQAYLVKCDQENNPQSDIDRGIVNILVGFAPLKPAEFVIIQIQQLAGQLQS
jgi:phage tail sheath protein FI